MTILNLYWFYEKEIYLIICQIQISKRKCFCDSLQWKNHGQPSEEWGSIRCKHTVRWQHLSQIKARLFWLVENIFFQLKMLQAKTGTGTAPYDLMEPHCRCPDGWNIFKDAELAESAGKPQGRQRELPIKNTIVLYYSVSEVKVMESHKWFR